MADCQITATDVKPLTNSLLHEVSGRFATISWFEPQLDAGFRNLISFQSGRARGQGE